MNKVLVVGGAGFIGSHLSSRLLSDNYLVTVVDNLITGRKSNIEEFLNNPNFNFIEKDISKEATLPGDKFDFVFHLASPASPKDYAEKPEETLLANSLGTLNILDFAKKFGSKVLIASTSEVYGDPAISPQTETYWGNVNSFGPRSCYDESKRFAEAASYVYLHKYSLDLRIVRIFNTYGPNMQKDDGRVVSNFINQAISGQDITIYGDGSQTRSFCFVSDMVDGIYKAMFTSGTSGEVINLGNPGEFTMLDLAEKIKNMTKSESKIVFKDLPPDDPKQRKPDIAKAGRLLGWSPQVLIDEGLDRTINYYRK